MSNLTKATEIEEMDVVVPEALQYSATVGLILVIVAGGVGNFLTVLIVILNKSFRRQNIYILIANQSLADLILLFILSPIKLYSLITLESPGIPLCGAEDFGSKWLINSSALCILFTAVYRYIQIVHPMYFRRIDNVGVYVSVILYIWTAPMLVLLPGMVMGPEPRIYYDKFTIRCVMFDEELWSILSRALLVLFYIPEVCVTPLCYLGIIIKVRKAQKKVGIKKNDDNATKKDNVLTKTTFAIFGVFLINYVIPGIISAVTADMHINIIMIVRVIKVVIARIPPFLNVLIYVMLNKKMRDSYRRLIFFHDKRLDLPDDVTQNGSTVVTGHI